MSGDILWSSTVVVATKLNPLKSWCALALGGTPGESSQTHTSLAWLKLTRAIFWTFSTGMLKETFWGKRKVALDIKLRLLSSYLSYGISVPHNVEYYYVSPETAEISVWIHVFRKKFTEAQHYLCKIKIITLCSRTA